MSDTPFAVITAASSGIGLELARLFAEEGLTSWSARRTTGSKPPPNSSVTAVQT
jgi:NAD(P)-dependent dehydrogenase (short-subunit alcohol dehydrogenase family)